MEPPLDNPRKGNEAVSAYVDLFAQGISRDLIANLDTTLKAARADGWLFPVSINDGDRDENCYLCSPRAHYFDYAAYELSRVRLPWLQAPLRRLLKTSGAAFHRRGLDRVVIVNNWLLSTNLYPAGWNGEGLVDLVAELTARYPEHAILFRSLNARQNPVLLPALQQAGARILGSRVVWHFDGTLATRFTRTPDYRRDLRLLERGDWDIVGPDDLQPGDMDAFARLYAQLYVEKYTGLNPQYTARWFTVCHEAGLLRFQGLRDRTTGRWLGVVGIFERDGALTSPVVGYDTSLPPARGLYRVLATIVLREAARRGLLLNLSAGVGSFKQFRGGVPCAEYTAVFDAHLPRKRRWAWQFVEALSSRLALPLAWRVETGRWGVR